MILEGSEIMAMFTAQNSEQELTTALTQVLLRLFIVRRALCKKTLGSQCHSDDWYNQNANFD